MRPIVAKQRWNSLASSLDSCALSAQSANGLGPIPSWQIRLSKTALFPPRGNFAHNQNDIALQLRGISQVTTVYILGAGTPVASTHRFGTSFVVSFAGRHLMFDCGPAATHKLVKAGLWPTEISNLFFTHHHYDHNADYPCFLLNRWDQSVGQEPELHVWGPSPTGRVTEGLINERHGVFREDITARRNHPGSQNIFVNRGGTLPRKPPEVFPHDIDAGFTIDGDNWKVTAGWAAHVQPWLDSLAYRLETPEGTVVFTGDTKPCEEVVNLAHRADVLVCMCWDDQDRMSAQEEGKIGMSGTRDAASIARDSKAKRLLLVHCHSNMDGYDTRKKAYADISNLYNGEVVLAEEGMRLEL